MDETVGVEDRAQAEARSGIVEEHELPPGRRPPSQVAQNQGPDTEKPSLDELRNELHDQFGSIRIVDRGKYELNLMELFEREECIIELQENGRYVIQVPETLGSDVG